MASGSRTSGPIPVGQRRTDARPTDAPRVLPGHEAPSPRPRKRRDPLLDPDAPSWVHKVSIALCVLLMLAALVALAFQRPGGVKLRTELVEPPPAGALAASPTVEPLDREEPAVEKPVVEAPSVLQRLQERAVAAGLTQEADLVAAGSQPGCLSLEPEGDLCLEPAARLRIAELHGGMQLLSGHVVVSVERPDAAALPIGVGDLRVETKDAVLGLELQGERAVVRVLRGAAQISAGERVETLASAQSAIYQGADRGLEVLPQRAEEARRDWELLAARKPRE